jgi:hypothetical protein
MSRLSEEKSETKLEKKIKDKYGDFYERSMAKGKDELNFEVQQLAKGMADNNTLKEADDELRDAAATYNELKKPYSDYERAAKDKIYFIRNRLKELGEG